MAIVLAASTTSRSVEPAISKAPAKSQTFFSVSATSQIRPSQQIWIFRFPNVVGARATHGAIHDFMGRLAACPETLKVFGDGSQTKPYMHVTEVISAMKFIVARATDRRSVFNIGPNGRGTSV